MRHVTWAAAWFLVGLAVVLGTAPIGPEGGPNVYFVRRLDAAAAGDVGQESAVHGVPEPPEVGPAVGHRAAEEADRLVGDLGGNQ